MITTVSRSDLIRSSFLTLSLALLPCAAFAAAGVSGDASGVTVSTDLVNLGPTPIVQLDSSGGSQQQQVSNLNQPALVSAATITVTTTGTVGDGAADSHSTATVEGLQLLGGLITADMASATSNSELAAGSASSTVTGATFVNLVINGMPIVPDPDPNTSITIPGIATITLNEQLTGGDGITSSSLEVNLIHVTLLLTPGEIIVAHAFSGVGIYGVCTGSGASCQTAADCPSGEGCCGNSVLDAPSEQCDDGNAITDDLCENTCSANANGDAVIGCEDLPGSSIVPLFVRRASLGDWNQDMRYERWKSNGDFALFDATAIDPDSERTTLVLSQGTTSLYDATLEPPSFHQMGSAQRPRWRFRNNAANSPGAIGWRTGYFKQKLNRVRSKVRGNGSAIEVSTGVQPMMIRETIRVGDVCATSLLACVPAGGSTIRLRCKSNPN